VPGIQELLVIAVVALFVLGPERLPEVMRAGGRLLTTVRNYGVTASKELRGVAELGGLSEIEQEVSELRRELDRTRADLRRAMRETMSSADVRSQRSDAAPGASPGASPDPTAEGPVEPRDDASGPRR